MTAAFSKPFDTCQPEWESPSTLPQPYIPYVCARLAQPEKMDGQIAFPPLAQLCTDGQSFISKHCSTLAFRTFVAPAWFVPQPLGCLQSSDLPNSFPSPIKIVGVLARVRQGF